MAKILVLGASGMLGHKACQLLPRDGHAVIGTVRTADAEARVRTAAPEARLERLDVLDEPAVGALMDRLKPEWVLNAVGLVKQKKDAESRAAAVALNSHLPHRLAALCATRGARLVHVSTDCVFDGTRGGYRETDPSDARDVYGKSKFLGETDPGETSALTLRTSIIGREITAPAHGLIEWFLSQRGRRIKGFANAVYTGFTTIELVRVVGRVVARPPDLRGTVQVASAPISKYELLRLAKEAYGADVEIERDEAFRCDRSLVMESFARATGYAAPSWPDMIREMAQDPTPYGR